MPHYHGHRGRLREVEIDQRSMVLFRAVRGSGRWLAERKVKDMQVLTSWQQLVGYCHTARASFRRLGLY